MIARRNIARRRRRRSGLAYILALLLMSITTIMAASFAAGTNLTLAAGANQQGALNAQMAAESGMAFAAWHMTNISIGSDAANTLEAIRDQLMGRLNGTGNLAGRSVAITDNVVTIPSISLGADLGSFAVAITEVNASKLRMTVTGQAGVFLRVLSLDFNLQAGSSTSVFNHAVVSNGIFVLSGNAKIRGTNNADEADVISLSGQTQSFFLSGNSYIEGDVYANVSSPQASLSGNSTIAGYGANDSELASHIHSIEGDATIPEVDPSVFESFATTDVTAGTSTSGNKTFTNIRILRNTNKTFSGNITLKGVIFIEAPNQITFSGNLTVKGVIVTEDAGDNAYNDSTIHFSGSTFALGVDALPDEGFSQLKQLPGSFLLAPGFGVTFSGNFGTMNGTIAADKFTFSGNSGGTVHGSILSYGSVPVVFSGNSTFYFDHSDMPEAPPGFAISSSLVLVAEAGSYAEN